MIKKNYFWGVFLVLGAAYLIISQLGYLPAFSVFTVVATMACIAAFVHSLLHLSFGGMLFPLAFLGILYDKQLGITAITPWTILLAALLGTIGLNLIFSRKKWEVKWKHKNKSIMNKIDKNVSPDSSESIHGEYVYMKSSFGSGNATLQVDINFSGVELFIPDNWKIVNHLDCTVAGLSEKGKTPSKEHVTLTLEGESTFSGVTVYYV